MTKQANTAVTTPVPRMRHYTDNFTLFFLAFCAGLALSRLMYEAAFPQMTWLARPVAALMVAAGTAFLLWLLWLQFEPAPTPFVLAPFLLNLLWLADPTVDLVRSRFIFAAAIWLTAVSFCLRRVKLERWRWLTPLFVALALLPVYLLTMSHAVGTADTFEFQVVTPQLGIVHPTGYPLYLIVGKLFTMLPVGTLAWRLNLASAIYAVGGMSFLAMLLFRLTTRPWPALLGATLTGLTVTFWSQAIIAEVYALHALLGLAALWLMGEIGDWRLSNARPSIAYLGWTRPEIRLLLLAGLLGLGMTNHVTTVFLLPPAVVTTLLAYRASHHTDTPLPLTNGRFLLKLTAVFLLPLLLYAYLPLRWQAVNGEPMGLARFTDWIIGGRFQGALQWRAWLDDPARYAIVGRLFVTNWGWFNLGLAVTGMGLLLWRRWQTAVPLLLLWVGATFYALNYYVPDLAVFLLPAQWVVGIGWAVTVWALLQLADQATTRRGWPDLKPVIVTFLWLPGLLLATEQWAMTDQSAADGLEPWGRKVLALPLAEDAAILADSEKIAPLLYLQIAETLRPDLDISVWPDEAAYREQVNSRLAAGQTVYLARFLPGLQGAYHLRAVGPLTEIASEPLTAIPETATAVEIPFGPAQLVGYELGTAADERATAVTLYWQAPEPVEEVLHVYIRYSGHKPAAGQHPANNFYPTNAWKAGEIVADYHELPWPILAEAETTALEVALAPPFTDPAALPWQPVTQITLPPATTVPNARPYRVQIGTTYIQAAAFPEQTRPQTHLPLLVAGTGSPAALTFHLESDPPSAEAPLLIPRFSPAQAADDPYALRVEVSVDVANGRHYLVSRAVDTPAICGWMQPASQGCILGEVTVSGVPLPETAVNFDDEIALLSISPAAYSLSPGGSLDVSLDWLALADMAEDYTIFLQLVDADDRIVGQVDSWPVQGTYPTSQWTPGEMVADTFTIQLSPDMPPGEYRLLVGWYLLGSGQRLPVLNEAGIVVEDKLIVPGLRVP